jgi:N-acetylmuramoyl-L-alanine amidase
VTRRVLVGVLVAALIVAAGAVGVVAASGRSASRRAPAHAATGQTTAAARTTGTPLDRSYFASGSCVAFGPTSGDRHATVFLDAGHGGLDPGAVGVDLAGRTIEESQLTLPVELDVMALLRAKGFRVVVSRTTDSTVLRLGAVDRSGPYLSAQGAHYEVAARDVCANDAKARVMVGIYYDAGGSPQNAGSITAYDTDRPFSAANLSLANLVQNDVLARMDAQGWAVPNDGVLTDTGLGSLNGNPALGGLAGEAAAYDHLMLIGPPMAGFFSTPSQMPGVVVEPLYITDPFEGTLADSASDQMVIAQGIASAIEQFLAPPPVANKATASRS